MTLYVSDTILSRLRILAERISDGSYLTSDTGGYHGGFFMPKRGVIIRKRAEGRWTASSDHSNQETDTIQYIVDWWLIHIKPQVKDASYSKYYFICNRYIIPELGSRNINKLQKKDVQRYVDHMLSSGGKDKNGLSPKTVADSLSVLKSILKYALDLGYNISTNISDIKIHQSYKELRVLSREEQKELVSFLLPKLSDYKAVGILLSLYTGIRVGELCALRWEDISISNRTKYIHNTLQRIQNTDSDPEHDSDSDSDSDNITGRTNILIASPKSSCSIRTIPIPESFMTILEQIPDKQGYLLTGDDAHYLEPRTIQYYYKKQLELCGIKGTHFHTLRHTFAIRCIELGFDVKTLSELLGHSSVNITMNRYVHPSFELKRESMDKLSALLTEIQWF